MEARLVELAEFTRFSKLATFNQVPLEWVD